MTMKNFYTKKINASVRFYNEHDMQNKLPKDLNFTKDQLDLL